MPYLEISFNIPLRKNFTFFSDREVPVGSRVKTTLGRRSAVGFVVAQPSLPPRDVQELKSIDSVIDEQPVFDGKYLELARWLSCFCLCSLGEALFAMVPSAGTGRSQRGGDGESSSGGSGGREADGRDHPEPSLKLSHDQQNALEILLDTKDSETVSASKWFYLYGATGTGKTEVFIRLAQSVLGREAGVIYLVPEIALSHQLVKYLYGRFPGKIAVMHSGLTKKERFREWKRIQSGESRFVIGARSAIFAPVKNLGLIIVDEEHENTYKSSSVPRFHARQVAMRRSIDTNCSLVMGSATPSLEAWNLMEKGRLRKIVLRGQPAGGAPPRIRVVNLQGESNLLSAPLVKAMSRTLAENRQVLLFLNRRGFSYRYSCQVCAGELLCPDCSIPLTYHKNINAMLCHYCGYQSVPLPRCPHCSSMQMQAAGFGTEKIEEQTARIFPDKRIVRIDTDSTRRKGVLEQELDRFIRGETDILLGTQMIAKGLNAPKLKLAGLVNADSGLNIPDFRAAERAFALIIQVAGRTGRFVPDGQVIVQTFQPDNPVIQMAVRGQIDEFYESETVQRTAMNFPPFSRIFRVLCSGRSLPAVTRTLEEISQSLDNPHHQVLGPAESPIARIASRHRWQLIIRSRRFDSSHRQLREVLDEFRPPSSVRVDVDIDPVSML